MVAVANSTGPIPKRSDSRVRRNAPGSENTTGVVGVTKGEAKGGKAYPVPSEWHPVAKKWYRSLAQSGMAAYYEQSDWAQAYVIANELSVYLVSGEWTDKETGEKRYKRNGMILSALLNSMAALGTTEGERRRMRIELEQPTLKEVPASVTALDNYRAALGVQET